MTFGPSDRRRGRGFLVAALLAYALVVVVTPVLHHDFECHTRTPGHCVACIATPVGLGTETGALALSPELADVGRVELNGTEAPEAALPADTHGRSPPR